MEGCIILKNDVIQMKRCLEGYQCLGIDFQRLSLVRMRMKGNRFGIKDQ